MTQVVGEGAFRSVDRQRSEGCQWTVRFGISIQHTLESLGRAGNVGNIYRSFPNIHGLDAWA